MHKVSIVVGSSDYLCWCFLLLFRAVPVYSGQRNSQKVQLLDLFFWLFQRALWRDAVPGLSVNRRCRRSQHRGCDLELVSDPEGLYWREINFAYICQYCLRDSCKFRRAISSMRNSRKAADSKNSCQGQKAQESGSSTSSRLMTSQVVTACFLLEIRSIAASLKKKKNTEQFIPKTTKREKQVFTGCWKKSHKVNKSNS